MIIHPLQSASFVFDFTSSPRPKPNYGERETPPGLVILRRSQPAKIACLLPGSLADISAADVTYNTASFPSLLKTLTSLLSHARAPKLLLAYKERDPGERELWGLLEQRGVMLELVGKIRGAEEDGQVEIYVGGSK